MVFLLFIKLVIRKLFKNKKKKLLKSILQVKKFYRKDVILRLPVSLITLCQILTAVTGVKERLRWHLLKSQVYFMTQFFVFILKACQRNFSENEVLERNKTYTYKCAHHMFFREQFYCYKNCLFSSFQQLLKIRKRSRRF